MIRAASQHAGAASATATTTTTAPQTVRAQLAWKAEECLVREPSIALAEWLAKEDANDDVVVSVTDARLVSNKKGKRRASTSSFPSLFARNEILFLVQTDGLPMVTANHVRSVERSFHDFELFRAELVKRFPGSCPPPLPKTKAMGATRDPFVRKRARLLELFLQAVCDHPFFRNEFVFEMFIGSPAAFEASLPNAPEISEGSQRWRQALCLGPFPKDPVLLIDTIRSELKSAEKKLVSLKAAAKAEAEQSVAKAESTSKMVHMFDSWLACERGIHSPLTGTIQVATSASTTTSVSLPETLQAVVKRYNDHAACLLREYGEDQLETNLLDAARFELLSLEVWLLQLDAAMAAQKKLVRCEALAAAGQGSSSGGGGGSAHDLRDARHECAVYQRGLLCVEVLRFRQERILRAIRLRQSIAQMHLSGARAILDVWKGEDESSLLRPRPRRFLDGEEDKENAAPSSQAAAAKDGLPPPPPPAPAPEPAPAPASEPPKEEEKKPPAKEEEKKPGTSLQDILLARKKKLDALEAGGASEDDDAASRRPPPFGHHHVNPSSGRGWKVGSDEDNRRGSTSQQQHQQRFGQSQPPHQQQFAGEAQPTEHLHTTKELSEMFWNFVYCVAFVHVFFVLVFLTRGFYKETASIVVLAGITLASGFIVDFIHMREAGEAGKS